MQHQAADVMEGILRASRQQEKLSEDYGSKAFGLENGLVGPTKQNTIVD